jgi:copper chaperone CopZ
MKWLLLLPVFLLGHLALSAQTPAVKKAVKKAPAGELVQFTVYGNCGMCKERIETAAKSVEGVLTASWDEDSLVFTLSYNAELTNQQAIEEAIAAVGHDTENERADDKVYKRLHHCCKYERPTNPDKG